MDDSEKRMAVMGPAHASAAWLRWQRVGGDLDPWVDELETKWEMSGDITSMWGYVLSLCAGVKEGETEIINQIGTGPLWSMIYTWPVGALDLIEAEVSSNPRLRDAVRIVISGDPVASQRLDRLNGRR